MPEASAYCRRMTPRDLRRATAVGFAAVLVLATGCTSSGGSSPATSGPPTPSTAATSSTPTSASASSSPAAQELPQATAGTPEVVASSLEVPWGVAFLPSGGALVSERVSHQIVKVADDGTTNVVGTVPGVANDAGEGGLLGLALSPTFTRDRLVYAYLTTELDNRIVRFRYDDGGGLGPVSVVFNRIPKASNHDGGRLAFGPDGMLYATTGDALQPERAPDAAYLGGKVLRMTPDGKPAPGNPDPASVVWTLGHRNPQGIAFGPDKTVYEAEFGQNEQDEINELSPGNDYGWPSVEGTQGSPADGKTAPLLTFPTDDASPSGLAYAGGSLWLAALQGQAVYRIAVRTDGSLARPEALLQGEYGRLRTVAVAPDGSLWITTSNRDGRGEPTFDDDRIIRIPLTTTN